MAASNKGATPGDRPSCFVIGPIGDQLADIGTPARKIWEDAIEIWETVIAPACAAVDLEPVRADDITSPGEITEQVFVHLRDDEVVIADLTEANPNVMYELGLRHTKNKVTIQIGEVGRLPFDINVIRTARFVRKPHELNRARDQLTAMLRDGLHGNFQPVTATRLWSEGQTQVATQGSEAIVTEQTVHVVPEEPGYMEKIAEMEGALPAMVQTLEKWNGVFVQMAEAMVKSSEEVAASDARGGGMATRLAIANRLAASLNALCDELDPILQTYSEQMQVVDAGMSAMMDIVEQDPKQINDMLPLAEQVAQVSVVFKGTGDSARTTIQGARELGKASRQLKVVAGRMEGAITSYLEIAESIHRWAARLQRLPDLAKDQSTGPTLAN